MVKSWVNCPLFGGSRGSTFSHPYFSYPWKNVISGEFCPRAFLFAPIIIKWAGNELRTVKMSILGCFFCNYLLVFTGVPAPPKTSKTQGRPQGEPHCVFNCSSVGYFTMAAFAMAAEDPSFPEISEIADFHISGIPAQYTR